MNGGEHSEEYCKPSFGMSGRENILTLGDLTAVYTEFIEVYNETNAASEVS